MLSQVHDIYQTNPAFKTEFFLAFYVSTLSTNEKSSHRAAAGRKWKNKFRKSVWAVVFNPTCVSIYNLSMQQPGENIPEE